MERVRRKGRHEGQAPRGVYRFIVDAVGLGAPSPISIVSIPILIPIHIPAILSSSPYNCRGVDKVKRFGDHFVSAIRSQLEKRKQLSKRSKTHNTLETETEKETDKKRETQTKQGQPAWRGYYANCGHPWHPNWVLGSVPTSYSLPTVS